MKDLQQFDHADDEGDYDGQARYSQIVEDFANGHSEGPIVSSAYENTVSRVEEAHACSEEKR